MTPLAHLAVLNNSLLKCAREPKMYPTASRTGLLVFAPLKSSTRLEDAKARLDDAKGSEGEQAGSFL